MGFRFRKTLKMGPVNINFSKSGIGASVGVPGARITKKANGGTRTTLGVPGTGLTHVSETSGKKKTVSTPTKKEREKAAVKECAKNATSFIDLIPFSTFKDKILFMLAWEAVKRKLISEGTTAEIDFSVLTSTTFKIADINEMNRLANPDGDAVVETYTSNHLSDMVNKGWFVRESRGVYKINDATVRPYVKQLQKG